MTKRIDTLRSWKGHRTRLHAKLEASLKFLKGRVGVTKEQLLALNDDLTTFGYYDNKITQLEGEIEAWGDEWAQDDWPHAIHARAPAVGAQVSLNCIRGD